MNKPLAIGFGVGLVVIAIGVAAVLYVQRGAHIDVHGQILKVRTAPLDEHSSVAVIDFRVTNPADYPFEVRDVTVELQDYSGKTLDGMTVSGTDMGRLFAGVPLLGQNYNAPLVIHDRIAPHQTQDRMVATRLEVPDSELDRRKGLVIRIDEVDGAVSQITGK
jgi:hypothetical protein